MLNFSKHYKKERGYRNKIIRENIGIGNVIDSFYIDRKHPNGAEIHSITDTAIIIVQNANTHVVVTLLIARPEQLRRYYRNCNKPCPDDILRLALQHEMCQYNDI